MLVPRAISADVSLRVIAPGDATGIAAALSRGRRYLAPWEPVRPDEYFTSEWWSAEITRQRLAMGEGTMLPLILAGDDPAGDAPLNRVLGRFTLGGIARGPFQSAGLGYWVAESSTGRGLATASVQAIIEHARDRLHLHRIEASTLVHNTGSRRVLEKAGFEQIGHAPRYLSIAGSWQDHVLFQRILHDS